MGISEREHHIKVLEQFLHDYQEWGEDLELEKTIKYVISSLKTDLKYDLLYEGEDIYTKDDMAAMLTEILLECEENTVRWYVGRVDGKSDDVVLIETLNEIIQQKINKLRGEESG